MIRTFTLNPSVDVSLVVPELIPVHKNRATSSSREPGGGGVNVARLLVRLGAEVECVVAVGGATGSEVIALLHNLEVVITELVVSGSTRESVQLYDALNDVQYRVTLDGPTLMSTVAEIEAKLRSVRSADVNVFSGSLPPGCPDTAYADLSLVDPDAFTIVDTSGEALAASAGGSIDLIKPSLREFERLADRSIANAADLKNALSDVLRKYPTLGSILVSLGGAGAVLGRRSESPVRFIPPEVPVVSAVGAGDSVVAGIAWGMSRGEDLITACRLGVAAGTATVATPGTSLCSAVSALELLGRVSVDELQTDYSIR